MSSELRYRFYRDAALTDILYTVEVSDDLTAWERVHASTGPTGWFTVGVPLQPGDAKMFARLKLYER